MDLTPPRRPRDARLLLLAAGLLAVSGWPARAESALFVVDPASTAAARITLRGGRSARAVITARGGPGDPTARAGLELRRLAAGPLTLGGAFAEVARPASGGATSPRWYAPAAADLNASLVPGSRAGVSLRAGPAAGRTPVSAVVPAAAAAAWLADDTLSAAVALRVGLRALFADAAVAASRALVVEAPGLAGLVRRASAPPHEEDALETSWFPGTAAGGRILHGLVRAGADADRLAASASVLASLPAATLPGVGVRLAARGEPAPWLRVDAVGSLASPDLRDPSGGRVDPPGRWEARVSVGTGPAVTLGVGRAYAASEAAYAGVALAPGRLATARTDWEARISARPRGGGGEDGRVFAELRSVSAGGAVRVEGDDPPSWKADARAMVALAARAVVVEPSVRLDQSEGAAFRVRAELRRRERLPAGVREAAVVVRLAYEAGAPWAPREDEGGEERESLAGGVEMRLMLDVDDARDAAATDPG